MDAVVDAAAVDNGVAAVDDVAAEEVVVAAHDETGAEMEGFGFSSSSWRPLTVFGVVVVVVFIVIISAAFVAFTIATERFDVLQQS